MIELIDINHHIQKYILSILMHQKIVRFRDMKPPRVDTNLYSYHLKVLIKQGIVAKVEGGYTLGERGLAYVDRVSQEKFRPRTQPKIITMLVVQNSSGDVLLLRRTKQPHINTWTLPYGKVHIDDDSILEGARREWREKIGGQSPSLTHAGDCYIRINSSENTLSSTLAHVFYATCDEVTLTDNLIWARPHKLSQYYLAPLVEEIVARTFFRDPYFFEEFEAKAV